MKKLLVRTTLFLLVCLFLYPVFVILWGELAPKKVQKNIKYKRGMFLRTKIHELPEYKNVDILFLGSSHALVSFDPRVFKEQGADNVFNLGTSSQAPINTEFFLNRYLDVLNPKFVICDVYPLTLFSDGVEATTNIISNLDLSSDIFKLAWQTNDVKVYNTLIFAMYRNFFNIGIDIPFKYKDGVENYIAGGYIENPSTCEKDYAYQKRQWEPTQEQLQIMKRIVAKLNGRGIKVLLVQAPYPRVLFDSYTNNDEIDDSLSEIAEYVNFNRTMDLDEHKYFKDYNHLNNDGARLFDLELIKYLKEKGYWDYIISENVQK